MTDESFFSLGFALILLAGIWVVVCICGLIWDLST